jgi:cytochrome c nitrite reductase small subunit
MKLPLLIGFVALVAVAVVALYVTDFTTYLGSDPTTCNNCHVMDNVYEGWYHAGHKQWTTCNDCHTPHALIPKYLVKAENGYHHVTAFISGNIPTAIRAREVSRRIVQDNCKRCHETTIQALDWDMGYNGESERYCFSCHRSVAHGQRGLSILPYQDKEVSK